MPEACCGVAEAGSAVCELPAPLSARSVRAPGHCPRCGERGKPVEGQTVKSLLSVSLRAVQPVAYYFCRTRTCPVVYFSLAGQTFTTGQVRERVYQKEPRAADVPVCYCFAYLAGTLRAASAAERDRLMAEIHAGIQAGQCACDLRNPQGSCCLANVRAIARSGIPANTPRT